MQVKLKNVRLAFPNIWHPQQVQGQGKPAHSATLLLAPDHPQLAEIRKAMLDVANEKWGKEGKKVHDALSSVDKLALHNGDLKDKYDGFPGNFYISARSVPRPAVFDRDKTPLVEADGRPYGGCYVNAVIDFWAQDNQFGKRINATLSGLQFYRDGDAFSGSAPASADDFDSVSDEEAETDPAAGLY